MPASDFDYEPYIETQVGFVSTCEPNTGVSVGGADEIEAEIVRLQNLRNGHNVVLEDPPVVGRQSHYTSCEPEPIDVIEGWNLNFRLGNVVKYIGRHTLKDDPIRDLEKARWYLDREIQALKNAK